MPTTRPMRLMHVPDDLLEKLTERAPRVSGGRSTSDANATCLSRYFAMLAIGEREVRAALSESDIKTAFSGLSSVAISDTAAFLLAASDVAETADDEGLPELAAKLRALSPLACGALVDMCERARVDKERERVADFNAKYRSKDKTDALQHA